jgi:hypothetical protein
MEVLIQPRSPDLARRFELARAKTLIHDPSV